MKYISLIIVLLFWQILWPSTTQAQFRYVASIDLQEEYVSSVYASGQQDEGWDLITEIEPRIRFYYNVARSLLMLHYSFMFQIFSQTRDAQGGPLTGYSNHLDFTWSYLLRRRLELGFQNRFTQGTENVNLRGSVSADGGYQTPQITTGYKFINNSSMLGLQYRVSERWTATPRVITTINKPYDQEPTTSDRGMILEVETVNRLARALSNHLIFVDTEASYLWMEGTSYTTNTPINTMIFAGLLGWQWQFLPLWDAQIAAGAAYRYMEQTVTANTTDTSFEGIPAPVVESFIRFRRGSNITLRVDYHHGWEFMPELAGTTSRVTETDVVGLELSWLFTSWRIDGGGSFRYIRNTSLQQDLPDDTATITIGGDVGLSYLIFPGLSVTANYQITVITDPPQGINIESIRHTSILSLSIVWPPPPPQDLRLNRRESEYQPVFSRSIGSNGEEGSSMEGNTQLEDDPSDPNSPNNPNNPNNPHDPNDRHRYARPEQER